MPDNRKLLEESADLGRRVAALLDTEADVSGVTAGKLDPFFRHRRLRRRRSAAARWTPNAGDLAVTAGWGHAGKGGVTMPAKGRIVEREYDKAERAAIAETAAARGLTADQALALLGPDHLRRVS